MFAALTALFTALLSAGSEEPRGEPGVRSMVVEQRLIVRVPVQPRFRGRLHWEEVANGPRCVPVSAIAGASLAGEDGIDFLLRNRQRVRAKLDDDCGGLDFYDGFYVTPQDQRLCARRDTISSRVGRTCGIDRFRLLVPRLERGE